MKYCDFNGCPNKIKKGRYCDDHKSTRNKTKAKKSIYHNSNKPFYNSDVWKHMRSVIYQREKGLCQRCKKFVFGKQAQVHHVVPIKENPLLKLEPNNLKLLCPECHMIEENQSEKEKVFSSFFQIPPSKK